MKLTNEVYLVGSGVKGFSLTDNFDCHVYLIDGGDELALLDTGAGYGIREILENVERDGFSLDKLKYVLLTHGHADHAGGTKKLVDATGVKVCASELTAKYLENGDEDAISLTAGKAGWFYPSDYKYEATKVDTIVKEGDTISVGKLTLEVIETPGHSGDHISYLMKTPEKTYFFAGDLIFYEGRVATQFIHDCNVYEIGKSIEKLKDKEIDVLLPGHDPFVLKNGQSHIDRGRNYFKNTIIPPSIIY